MFSAHFLLEFLHVIHVESPLTLSSMPEHDYLIQPMAALHLMSCRRLYAGAPLARTG